MKPFRLALISLLIVNPIVMLAQGPIPTPAGAQVALPILIYPASGVNGGGVVIPAQLKLQDGTAAAPSLTFASQTNKGLYSSATNEVSVAIAGTQQYAFQNGTFLLANGASLALSSGVVGDVFLARDAGNTLALRNGTNAQKYNVYNTTIGSEFFSIDWITSANTASIGTYGAARAINIMQNGAAIWGFNTSGNIADAGSHSITAGSTVAAGAGKATIAGAQDQLIQLTGTTTTLGIEFNVGTPSLGTCTGGSLTAGAKNTLFEVTGNTSGSCVVNFGTPIWQNAPLCFVNDETALIAARISARTTNSITITGLGSGDAGQVYCLGRVGT